MRKGSSLHALGVQLRPQVGTGADEPKRTGRCARWAPGCSVASWRRRARLDAQLRTSAASPLTGAPGTPQGTVQWPLPGTPAPGAPAAAGAYATIQQQLPPAYSPFIEPEPSIDTIARQTAAGYRAPGLLMAGLSGGGAEGIDLIPQARQVLHAQQVMTGDWAPGPLVTTPPAGVLSSVASYAPYGAGASNAGSALPPLIGPPQPLYKTAQTPIAALGGSGPGGRWRRNGWPAQRRTEP
jgi:hypothetical protein